MVLDHRSRPKSQKASYVSHTAASRSQMLAECTLDYDRCQVNWFTITLLRTTDRNDHGTQPIAYHNLEQNFEPRLEQVSDGY